MTNNYDNEFLVCLQKEMEDKIAFISNKDYKYHVYNLGRDKKLHTDLIDLSNILGNILKCNDCYADFNIEDIVSLAKNKINNC